MLHHYLKTALRHLWKYKVQNLIGVMGLAVGLFSFSVCFYCFRFVNEMDNCYAKSDRLVDILLEFVMDEKEEAFRTPYASPDLAFGLRGSSLSGAEAFCTVSEMKSRPYVIETGPGKMLPYDLNTIETDTFYNQLFTPELIGGTWEEIKNAPNSVILAESSCRRLFGDGSDPLGKTMMLSRRLTSSPESTPSNGGIVYTIRGVMKDLPLNASISFLQHIDIVVVNDTEGWINGSSYQSRNSMSNSRTYALLREGISTGEFQKELENKEFRFEIFHQEDFSLFAFAVGQYERERSSVRYMGLIALSVGSLILVVGLLNFFYFLIGSFRSRMHEYAIRKAMGSNSFRLFSMLWVQTLLILCFAGMVMLTLIELLAPYLHFTMEARVMTIEAEVLYKQALLYWGILVIFCAVVCALVTGILAYRTESIGLSALAKKRSTHYLRNTMLGIQFFVSWIFVACTFGLFLQTDKTSNVIYETLSAKEKRAIFHVNLNYAFLSAAEKEAMIGKIASFSGVEIVSRVEHDLLKLVKTMVRDNEMENHKDNWKEVILYNVDSGFFRLVNLPLVSGRLMRPGEMVVNESFARERGEVLGRVYDRYMELNTVSGITKDFVSSVGVWGSDVKAAIFKDIERPGYSVHCYVRAYPGFEKEVRAYIQQELQHILPESVNAEITTLAEDIAEKQFVENKLKNVILLVSVVSLFITLLGVYSAVTLDTVRRQKEIAIRKINGAKVKSIVFLFVRLYAVLLVGSALCAFPLVALLFEEWRKMYTVFFEYDLLFWLGVFLFVSLITGFTVFFKVMHIARVNPAETIRNE